MHSKALTLLSVAALALAAPLSKRATITAEEITDRSSQGERLLRFGRDAEPVWRKNDDKWELKRNGEHFVDVTDVYIKNQELLASAKTSKAAKADYPEVSHQDDVKPLIEKISLDNLKSNLDKLTSFNNRYYDSDTGAESSDWIFSTVKDIASGNSAIEVTQVEHSFAQKSIIAHIPGGDGPLVILGAHQDSINQDDPSGRAPGADDDGTGTVNLLEAFRILVESEVEPKSHPVEFHWYAGEEGGLLGSQDIASSYKSDGKEVFAQLQLDMTGYTPPGSDPIVGINSDHTDKGLNTYVGSLVDSYLSIKSESTSCGYECSDHASWNEQGYPASFPFEAPFGDDNPNIHSENDTIDVDGFNWDQVVEFTKLAVAYAYELSA